MKRGLDIFRIARAIVDSKVGVFNYVPQRGVQYSEALKWVRPEQKPKYDPARSGDLVPLQKINPDSPYYLFNNSKELETADDNIKRIFSIDNQMKCCTLKTYQRDLVEKVRNNPYDNSSLEVSIAKLTAEIHFVREVIKERQIRCGPKRCYISQLIDKRKKLLARLRKEDYKKFEWLLETLKLEYKPTPDPNIPVTRKNSLILLAKLKVERAKEKKLAAVKKSYDEQKVPFLEFKIAKLKEIKEKEEKYKLPVTVTDADIEDCIQRLNEVKIQVEERAKRGYVRKIHPYFLEPYNENLLWEKEKAGEKIREELIRSK